MNGEREWDRADSAVSIVYKSGNGRVKNKKKREKEEEDRRRSAERGLAGSWTEAEGEYTVHIHGG